ncbi:competence type IV pilus assembly protein ComGB [Sporosarcina sp. YIM B06819]|uniref:competence type IV pilus assembly protein ComGB n=1 Tax=Sporosarcina sp. YIM B06819 TaxID=3081769 RepID=UPI00298C756D|nr:competence type IV pilus assembly protein ComGB [Sporosarcina sp. YIM B06819]
MVKWIKKASFQKAGQLQNRAAFLDRLAVLLTEGYTFYNGIMLLLPHHMKKYDTALATINDDLKKGLGVTLILSRIGFSTGMLLPIAIAELDGRLALALKEMAARLRKKEQQQRKLKNLLAYPTVLFVFIGALLLAFRRFFLPNMEALAVSRNSETTGFASTLPSLVTKIPDVVIGMGFLSALLTVTAVIVYKKFEPKTKVRVMMSLPILGTFFAMYKTRDFSSEIGSLLQSGLSMQDALDVLIDQHLDIVLSEIASSVKELVIFGESFHIATNMTAGLTAQLAAFAKHGEDSGHLAKELLIYSEHLSESIDDKLTKGLAMLQPILFSLIAICILAAYLALLLPVYGMMDKL